MGEGWGGGGALGMEWNVAGVGPRECCGHPPPQPSPARGEGGTKERGVRQEPYSGSPRGTRRFIPALRGARMLSQSHRTCRARGHAEVERAEGSVPDCWKASAHSRVSSNASIATQVAIDALALPAGSIPRSTSEVMRGGMVVATVRRGPTPVERGGAARPHRTFSFDEAKPPRPRLQQIPEARGLRGQVACASLSSTSSRAWHGIHDTHVRARRAEEDCLEGLASADKSSKPRRVVGAGLRRHDVRNWIVREAKSRGLATLSMSGAPGVDALHQPAPGDLLAFAGGLGDGDLEILQLRLDLLRRQHLQAGDEDGALQHRGLGAVEALEGAVQALMDKLAMEARARVILGDMVDGELPVCRARGPAACP